MKSKIQRKPISELFIRNQICSYLFYRKIFVFIHDSVGIFDEKKKVYRKNTSPYRRRGVADLLGIYRGRFLAIEVKSAKGKLSEHQVEFLDEVVGAGGIAFMAKSIEDVKYGLEKADEVYFKNASRTLTNAPGSIPKDEVTLGMSLDHLRRSGAI